MIRLKPGHGYDYAADIDETQYSRCSWCGKRIEDIDHNNGSHLFCSKLCRSNWHIVFAEFVDQITGAMREV